MAPMKCHYEVLAVQKDASADDLKKSYRKLALKWHPDKNPDNIDECTQQFRQVQQAYDVLGDPQERAWYDKHREAILQGGMGHGDDYEDTCLDVFQFFNSSCYKGFGDDKEGFYRVYDEVFKTLAEEDRPFMEDEDFVLYDFGDSKSVFEEVAKPFYDYWECYCTAKSFVWVEKYDTREAPERRVRRLMEAENKKLRDASRKERNEEVRALVKYVKKRDKRVQEYKKKLEERAEEIQKKSEEQRQRHLEEGRKKMENYKEAEWSSSSALEDHYKELEAKYDKQFGGNSDNSGYGEDIDDEEQEEAFYDDLYCVACDRMFKNEKTYKNHEKSKKHKDFVAIIKAHMAEEDGELTEEGKGNMEELTADGLEEAELEENDAPQRLSKKQKKKRKQQKNAAEMESVDNASESLQAAECDKDVDEASNSKSKREKRRDKKNRGLLDSDDDEAPTVSREPEAEINIENEGKTETIESDGETPPTATDKLEEFCDRLTDIDISSQPDAHVDSNITENNARNSDADVEISTENTIKKKKGNNKPDPNQKHGSCGICGWEFPSRSKLFEHIKSTGHAMTKQAAEMQEPSGQKQPKKNKKKKGK